MTVKLSEQLKSRREATETEKLEKGLDWVPYNMYTFAEFETADKLADVREEYTKVFSVFVQLADNIMFERPEKFVDKLLNLTNEFVQRILNISLQEGEILRNGSIALFKSNGELQWVGVPTNKFQDRENDILADVAHRKFVKMLKDGTAPMPKLYPWHTGEIGVTTWVDYDERGFLVAGGKIHKQYENFVINLVGNSPEPLGMSHGVYAKDIKRDNDGTIIEYKSFEFSFLPLSRAANLLTSFTTN